jgi:hypothetical protein
MSAAMLRMAAVLPIMFGFMAPGSATSPAPADAGRLVQALARQVMRCWAPPPPLETAPVVTVNMELRVDGQVSGTPTATADPATSPSADAAIAAAVRAVHTCAPYQLPPEQYATWRRVAMRFDPRFSLPMK